MNWIRARYWRAGVVVGLLSVAILVLGPGHWLDGWAALAAAHTSDCSATFVTAAGATAGTCSWAGSRVTEFRPAGSCNPPAARIACHAERACAGWA